MERKHSRRRPCLPSGKPLDLEEALHMLVPMLTGSFVAAFVAIFVTEGLPGRSTRELRTIVFILWFQDRHGR